jgi:hypothetical protein
MLADKEKRKQYLVIAFAFASALISFIYCVMLMFPRKERLCRNNAVGFNRKDGPTLCSVQALLMHYTLLSLMLSWLMQAVDLFCKVVLNMKSVKGFMKYQLAIIFLLPLPFVIANIAGGYFGYAKIS